MGRTCELCEKTVSFGHQITRRGKAKYLGGVGTKITGISSRKFKPNTQKVRGLVDGTVRRIEVCTACIRSGKLVKPPARPDEFRKKSDETARKGRPNFAPPPPPVAPAAVTAPAAEAAPAGATAPAAPSA